MTRRLVVLLVGIVTATLLIAGLGTLVLANVRARHTTEQELRKQAENVSSNEHSAESVTDTNQQSSPKASRSAGRTPPTNRAVRHINHRSAPIGDRTPGDNASVIDHSS